MALGSFGRRNPRGAHALSGLGARWTRCRAARQRHGARLQQGTAGREAALYERRYLFRSESNISAWRSWAFVIIRAAIEVLGGRLEHVVRTRMFVTSIGRFDEIGRAHGEVFGAIRLATSMVEVWWLVGEPAVVEIAADAVVG